MRMFEDGCNDFRYGFSRSKTARDFYLIYSFVSGVPDDSGAAVDFKFYGGQKRRYRLRQRSRRTDSSSQTAAMIRQAADKFENLFSREIGLSIDNAVQLLAHDIAARVGFFSVDTGEMGRKLSSAYQRERRKRLGIKPGAKKGR